MLLVVSIGTDKFLISENADLNALAHAFRGAKKLEYNYDKRNQAPDAPQFLIGDRPSFELAMEDDAFAGYKKLPKIEDPENPEPAPGHKAADEIVEAPSLENRPVEQPF